MNMPPEQGKHPLCADLAPSDTSVPAVLRLEKKGGPESACGALWTSHTVARRIPSSLDKPHGGEAYTFFSGQATRWRGVYLLLWTSHTVARRIPSSLDKPHGGEVYTFFSGRATRWRGVHKTVSAPGALNYVDRAGSSC